MVLYTTRGIKENNNLNRKSNVSHPTEIIIALHDIFLKKDTKEE
jgi:hypothetical protein